MKISEVIKKLEEIRNAEGEIECKTLHRLSEPYFKIVNMLLPRKKADGTDDIRTVNSKYVWNDYYPEERKGDKIVTL